MHILRHHLTNACAAALLLLCVMAGTHRHTACAQSNTPLATFPTFNNTVQVIVVSGTTIYVGGNFTQATDAPANGGATITRNRIAAIDATTGALLPWDPNANSAVYALAVSGSTVYAGGAFTNIGGQARNRIAALDATVNTNNATAWDPNADAGVYALAVSGSTVYAGGPFTSIGGQARGRIAALDAAVNTNNATAWNPNAPGGLVNALVISGSTVYVGGTFTSIGGQARNRLAALDATVNTNNATAWDPNANSSVNWLAVSGTTVYVGGAFGNVGGQGRNNLAALDATVNTNNATAWNPNANAQANAFAVSGSRLYVGGNFTTIGGNARAYFAAFGPAPTAAYSGTAFPEAAANNGSITTTQDVTLTNDAWLPAGAFTPGTDFTATGVPAGLTIAVNRVSATVARVSFTGTATAHANANDASIPFTFTNAALASNDAASVTGLTPATLTLDFNDPTPPPPPPPPPPPIAPTISGGTFTASVGLPFSANFSIGGNPTPGVSVSVGTLPPGLTFTGSALTGIPAQEGTFAFTLQASNSAGSASANVTVNVGPAVPLVTGIAPASGTFGTAVTISGYNLAGANAVSIGGVAAQSFSMVNGSLVAIVASGGTGVANVSTPLGNASGGYFTFEQPPAPVLGFGGNISGGGNTSGGSNSGGGNSSGGNSGGGTSGGGAPNLTFPPIPTSDSNTPYFLPGSNIPIYAGFSLTQLSSSGATVGFPVPLQVVSVSTTGASLLIPPFALLPGTHRLTVRVGEVSVSTTVAIVRGAAPQIRALSVSSTTASGEGFTTVVSGTGFFRNGLARVFVENIESLYSTILDATTAQVHIPALLNVRNGTVKVRIQNFDGQATEATVRIVGRNAPLILSVTPRWEGGNLFFVVRGVAFSPRITAVLGRRQVTVLPGGTDTEFVVAVPSDYLAPTQGTASLIAENPDGQRYGFLVSARQFLPPVSSTFAEEKNVGTLASGTVSRVQAGASTRSNALSTEFRLTPNPASDALTLEVPNFTGIGRLVIVNMRGEEVMSGEVSGGSRQTVDIHALPSGVYVVRLAAVGVQAAQQVRIVR